MGADIDEGWADYHSDAISVDKSAFMAI